MKRILFSCLLFVVCITAHAQKPQTPQPPFNYNIDSVEYDNADKTVHLGATLTYPKTKGPFAVAVMITGSGQQDRDEAIFGHRPFAVIADYLTNHGMAVLRVDDRAIGKSKGEILKATSVDFADDVMTSINFLLTRKEIDKNKIGVIGHSEGGFIAPMIYTRFPKLAFIVSLAGTGISGDKILIKQFTNPTKGLLSTPAFDAYYTLTEKTLAIIHNHANDNDSIISAGIKNLYIEWKNSLTDSVSTELRLKTVTPEMYLAQLTLQMKLLLPWMKYFISKDPDKYWSKVQCPVLALNGEKDIQVFADENINAINASLKKANNKNATTQIIPGLNHLFQHCTKCTGAEYAELQETFSTDVLQIIKDWLSKNKFIEK